MDDEQLADALEANYIASFGMLARTCGGSVLERDDVVAISTGLPVAALNHGFIKHPPADPGRSIGDLVAFFDDAGVPFILRVRERSAPKVEAAFQEMGFPYADTVPGMALFPINDAPPPPENLTIQRLQDESGIITYRRVMAEGFDMPMELATRMITPAILDVPGFESYLGLVEGEPVATTSLFHAGGTAGIYNVATVPAYRRRGLGQSLTWHAVTRGRDLGCTRATLQASVMGKPVYAAMGFRTVAPHRTFSRPQGALK
jgi:GNAT superfamily N-acetyltransferase